MRLENLYLNFGKSSPEEQSAYISVYRLRRAEDMAKPASTKKRAAVKTPKINLTEEEKALMKVLGIKMKDFAALRDTLVETVEEESTLELFTDPTFEEDDE